MSKVNKDDILKALGSAQMAGVKEAVKEQAKEMGFVGGVTPGRANPQVTSVMEQVAQQVSSVRLQIQRRDPVSGKFTYLRGPGEIDARLIADKGLHEILDDWCGGGEYMVEITAPGQERITQNLTIGGSPQDPGYRAKQAVASGIPAGTAYDPSHYFGPPRPSYAPQFDNSSNMMMKLLEMNMAKDMMASRMATVGSSQPSQEVSELKAEMARMRDEAKRSEEERRRNEEMDRFRREAAEDRRRSEERFEKLMLEMNKDKTPAWMGLAQAALPAIAEFAKGKDATMGMLSNTFGTVLQAQQMAAQQQAETFKILMNRPSATDEISKMTSVFAQSQLTNLQTINQIVSSGLLDKGGGSPVVELLSQLIDQGGQVLQAAIGGGNGTVAGLESSNIIDAEINPPRLETAEAPQLNSSKEAQRHYDLNADPSFRVIIDQIKGNGNPREIALRLYRHGQPLREDQGHPLAKAWCRDPQNHSQIVLGQLGIPEERIQEIVTALIDLALWVRDGKDVEEFASISTGTRRRRRKRSIPAASPDIQNSFGYVFKPGQEDEEDEEDEDSEDEDSDSDSDGDSDDDLDEMPSGNGETEIEQTVDLKTPMVAQPAINQTTALVGV